MNNNNANLLSPRLKKLGISSIALALFMNLADGKTLATDVDIAPGQEQSWTLPETPENQRTLLRITARRQYEKLGGYGYYAQYLFNGQPLNASINRAERRLVNKESSFRRPDGGEVYWNIGDGLWHTFFTPDFTTDVSMYAPNLPRDPYTVVLDVTDLMQRGAPNVFTARNMIPGSSDKNIPVVLSLDVLTEEKVPERKLIRSISLEGQPDVQMLPGGALELVFGDKRLPFESRFSFPGGGWNELLATASEEAEKGWKPEVRQVNENQWEVRASGATYRLERVVERQAHRVTVRDTITNLTQEPQGILVSNYLNFKEQDILSCRMGGLNNDSLETLYSPANSTLFFPLENSGLGMAIEDDVFRNQSLLFYDWKERKTGAKNDVFAIGGGESYTVEWSIYWTPTPDYFDFINLVRNDWNSNITLEGPVYFTNYHSFAKMNDEQLASLLKIRNPKYVVFWEIRTEEPSPEWDNKIVFGHGPGMFDPSLEKEIKKLRTAIANVRRVAPHIRLSLYNISFFMTPHRPDDLRYKDSWITDADGNRRVSVYNKPGYVDFQTIFPTLENTFGKDYLKSMDFYLNDLGLDWVYWDESTGPGLTNSDVFIDSTFTKRATFNAWDGHTAKISRRKKAIEEKFALLPLITRPVFETIMEKAEKKGSFVLFNGAATTRQRQRMPSFSETQDTRTRAYETHLNTPLAFGYGKPTIGDLRMALEFGCIYARTHLDYTSSVVEHFYPFTPMELHAGWVKGKERIITAKSGEYGWEDGDLSARLLLWDAQGKMMKEIPVTKAAGEKIFITVPEGGLAVLERLKDQETE